MYKWRRELCVFMCVENDPQPRRTVLSKDSGNKLMFSLNGLFAKGDPPKPLSLIPLKYQPKDGLAKPILNFPLVIEEPFGSVIPLNAATVNRPGERRLSLRESLLDETGGHFLERAVRTPETRSQARHSQASSSSSVDSPSLSASAK
jgi:hypothetical protein